MKFPLEKIREPQKLIMDNIDKILVENKHKATIINAHTGTGKTLALLFPILKFLEKNPDFRVIIATRTHNQFLPYLQELKRLNFTNYSFLYGKPSMCSMKSSSKFDDGMCQVLKKNSRNNLSGENKNRAIGCKDYEEMIEEVEVKGKTIIKFKDYRLNEIIEKNLQGKFVNEKIIYDVALKYKVCPYYLNTYFCKKLKLICLNYNYLFAFEHTIEQLGFNPKKTIVVIDEAHNIDNAIFSIHNKNLSIYKIKSLKRDKTDEKLSKLLPELEVKIEKIASKNTDQILDTKEFLNLGITKDEILECEIDYKTQITKLSDEDLINHKRKIISIFEFLLDIYEKYENNSIDKIFHHLTFEKDKVKIQYIDCSKYLLKLTNKYFHSFFMSGTLYPIDSYEKKFFKENNKTYKIQTDNPFPKENRKIYIVNNVTTKWMARNNSQHTQTVEKMFKNIYSKYKDKNIAIFFTSYGMMNKYSDYMKKLSCNVLIQNGTEKKINKDIIENFENNKGNILMAVQKGVFSEGYDWKNIDVVIVFGIPYAPWNILQKEINSFYYKKFGSMFYGYDLPAMNASLQSIGRCIRNETDKGIIVLADSRFKESKIFKHLPKYIREETQFITI